ncbi:MAG: hypothetical protein GXO73_09810 [Calditrichaeota bacterium]|nr:hypothetical protein [Calditrichota bacterium]
MRQDQRFSKRSVCVRCGVLVTAVLGVLLLLTRQASAGNGLQVEVLGVPVKLVSTIGITVAADATGQHERIFCSFHNGRPPMFIAEIDPATGQVWKHYAPARSEQGAWAIATGSDGNVYVGTYYNGHLMRFDVRSRTFEDLGRPGDEKYFWTFSLAPDGRLYGGTYPRGKLIAVEPWTGAALDLGRAWDDEMYVRTTAVDSAGRVICGMGSTTSAVVLWDPSTGEKRNLTPDSLRGPGFAHVANAENGQVLAEIHGHKFVLRGERLEPAGPEEWKPRRPKLKNGLVVRSKEPSRIDLVDAKKDSVVRSFFVEGDGSVIFSLAAGPDGRLYGSSLLPLRMFAYDPAKNRFEDLRNPTTVGGEIYSFASLDGKLFLGAYPHADFTVYDPKRPWVKGSCHDCNPRNWGRIGYDQDRPIAMTVGPDRKIYIGSIPEYGHLGGALAVYDPATDSMRVFRNVVPQQSVVALASDTLRGRVVGGSSVEGGPGTRPVAREAVVFVWDVSSQKIVSTCAPVPGARAVRALAVVGDRIVGVADTTLFALDATTLRKLGQWPLGLLARYTPQLVEVNGKLVTTAGGFLVSVDPETGSVERLARVPTPVGAGPVRLGPYVYFSSEEKLLRVRID